jgi:predicted TIM-barrel fold metal-dependent hydrolase
MHIGEPMEAWRPVDPGSPHYDYYGVRHPEWHFHGKPGFPSHERLVAARDRVVERYPGIRFVGAHLGSLEYDLVEVGRRLDRYPNLMVDISARIIDVAVLHEAQVTHDFLERYSDRVIYGSDAVLEERQSLLPADKRAANLAALRETYRAELDFFRTGGTIAYKRRQVRGVGLTEAACERITLRNAAAWYGIG